MATTSMLGYAQQVLSKVSFDLGLFEKELRKAIRMLLDEDLPALRRWCLDNFHGLSFRRVVDRCFRFTALAN